jgi:hypothetical protein
MDEERELDQYLRGDGKIKYQRSEKMYIEKEMGPAGSMSLSYLYPQSPISSHLT